MWLRMMLKLLLIITLACGALVLTANAAGKSVRGDVIAYNAAGNRISDILLMEIERGVTVNLSRVFLYANSTGSHTASWSPDGNYLAMISRYNVTRGWRVIVLNPDTGDVTVVTQPYADIRNLSWYPVIKEDEPPRLVFNLPDRNERLDIYTAPVERLSRPELFIGNPAHDALPQWSPDGRWLAYLSGGDSSGYDLYVVDSTGENPRRLTTSANVSYSFDWSPDSQSILFAMPVQRYQSDIFTVNVESGEMTNLTQHESINMLPVWSGDHEHIVFMSNRMETSRMLFIMKADGSDLRLLVRQEVSEPAWSSDGNLMAYYLFGESGFSEIHVLDMHSGRSRQLSHLKASTWDPVWRPRGGS